MQSAAPILVIEDDPTSLELMVYLLRSSGYTPATAVDGNEGVDSARRQRPDLIISDVHMPNLDGYGVVRTLKSDSELKKVPIVAVTALAMVGDRTKILTAGFDGYIGKPIVPEAFVPEVETFLPADRRAKRSAAPQAAGALAAPQVRLPDKPDATLLVVDDVAANTELLRDLFEPSGYRVLSAKDLDSALSIAADALPDLIISDLHVGQDDGRDLLRRLKAAPQLAGIPVVILSSTARSDACRQACQMLGAARFIDRPIESALLLAEVEGLMKEHDHGTAGD